MTTPTKLKSSGFTLVEVIITLVIATIVGAMMFSVLGTSMTKSSEPIFLQQKSFALQQVMENLITAYEKYYAGDLPGFKDSIEAENSGLANQYAQYTDGQYTVVDNHYIKFDSNQEQTADTTTDSLNLLKVTIKNSNNETLTYIFAG